MEDELLSTLALTYVPGIGPINQRKILKFVDAKELWSLSQKELVRIFRGKKELIPHFKSDNCLKLAEKEIKFCIEHGIDILSITSDAYPKLLKHCADSPLILFKKGTYKFQRKLHIGVVGTRKMSNYGKLFIHKFIKDLNRQNIAIISGLAFGCDIEAHRAAIGNEIANVAVLAHGLNRISPVSHQKEAKNIINDGALVSEHSTFHNAEPINFVLRNRIIAGLSDGLVVIESDKKGGALATARFANNYNREVFAVPGRVEDKYSRGCNALIQQNQALLIRDADDLLQYFNIKVQAVPKQTELFIDLEPDEKRIYDFIKTNGKQQIDTLANTLEIPIYRLNGILLNLELKNVVKPLTGKFFEIV